MGTVRDEERDMQRWIVNEEFEIEAPDLGSAYEVANELCFEIHSIEPAGDARTWVDSLDGR
jgi:hypothetical protein